MARWLFRTRWISSLSLALLVCGCGEQADPASMEDPTSPEAGRMPVRWTLTDQKGRTLDAVILGRTVNKVNLRRLSDNQEFEIGIETLIPADQDRVKQLPIKAAPKPPPAKPTGMSWEVRRIQEDLDETVKEIVLTQELISNTASKMQRRTLGSKLERLSNREAALRAELTDLERAEEKRR